MSEARRFVGCLLLVASTGALAADGGPAAVFGVGKCDEATAIAARSFRSALATQPGLKVLSEAQTAQPFGGFTERTLEEVSGAIGTARIGASTAVRPRRRGRRSRARSTTSRGWRRRRRGGPPSGTV